MWGIILKHRYKNIVIKRYKFAHLFLYFSKEIEIKKMNNQLHL